MEEEMSDDDIAPSRIDRVIGLALGMVVATWLVAYAVVGLRLAFT
jgi:hypothetical protein